MLVLKPQRINPGDEMSLVDAAVEPNKDLNKVCQRFDCLSDYLSQNISLTHPNLRLGGFYDIARGEACC